MPRPQVFSREQKLPSCKVSVELLRVLEHFVLQRFQPPDGIAPSYSIKLEEKNATAEYDTIADYPHVHLPRNTQYVRVMLVNGRQEDDITLSFHKNFSHLHITCVGQGGSDKVQAVRDALLRLLEPYQTQNSVLYSGWAIPVMALIGIGFVIATAYFPAKRWLLQWLPGATLPVYLLLQWLKPYSTFDTRDNKIRTTAGNWFLLAILGAIVTIIVEVVFGR